MDGPLVSFLMPTFNRADRVCEAIHSALVQTYQNIEVVVYDDGSEDNTEEVIYKMRDKRIKYFKCKDNKGVPVARNKLLGLASGEYSCWLDSDDRCNTWRAEIMMDAMLKYHPPYIRTGQSSFGKPGDKTWTIPPTLVWRGGVCFASIMFPTKQCVGFDEKLSCCFEDMDWETQMAAKFGKGMNIPLTLYVIGRRAPFRMTVRYKNEDYCDDYVRCKIRMQQKQEAAVLQMRQKGYTKKPTNVPWSFLLPYLERFYEQSFAE